VVVEVSMTPRETMSYDDVKLCFCCVVGIKCRHETTEMEAHERICCCGDPSATSSADESLFDRRWPLTHKGEEPSTAGEPTMNLTELASFGTFISLLRRFDAFNCWAGAYLLIRSLFI
jgi:hypothetical protein